MNNPASDALAKAGIKTQNNPDNIPNERAPAVPVTPKKLVNGGNTLATIFSALATRKNTGNADELKELLNDIKAVSKSAMTKAITQGYEIESKHYIAINRVAIDVCCALYAEKREINHERISNYLAETFSIQEIYAETISDELTDDDFALQFMATAKLSGSVIKHLALTRKAQMSEDDAIELIDGIIEVVDETFDEIFEEVIPEGHSLLARKCLIEQAEKIFQGVVAAMVADLPDQEGAIKIPLLLKRFENTYRVFIEALTPFIEGK